MKNVLRISALGLLILSIILIHSCTDKTDKSEHPVLPVLTTTEVRSITQTTAISGGTITNDGGAIITGRGVCWNLDTIPNIENNLTINGSDTGSFSGNIIGLIANTTYYVRAYATNSTGTGYGTTVSFTTLGGTTGTVTDIEGNVYPTVTIGTQVWMAENLKTKKFRNGDPIPFVTTYNNGDATWRSLTTSAYCFFSHNDIIIDNSYGNLYNWWAVNDGRNIAPTGWHVASDSEWKTLVKNLGGENIAGGKLKEAGTLHWLTPNNGATNSYGFTALPGGERQSFDGALVIINYQGYWWSYTSDNDLKSRMWGMTYDDSSMLKWSKEKTSGLSVRCVKD
jgi:uncharacterized protein (TIGR02145 family)